jgi:hypothetical protein
MPDKNADNRFVPARLVMETPASAARQSRPQYRDRGFFDSVMAGSTAAAGCDRTSTMQRARMVISATIHLPRG